MFIDLEQRKSGFSLIEVLVVVGMIGILAAFTVVSLSSARMRSRDSKRVAFVKQINDALEIYYLQNGYYPTAITPGQVLKVGDTVYLNPVPTNPSPRNDGICANQDFSYSRPGASSYTLTFCLGQSSGNLASGYSQCANGSICAASLPPSPSWSPTELPGLLLWLKADSLFSSLVDGDLVTTWSDSSGNNNHATGSGTGRPTYQTAELNSWPTVQFDGSNDVLNFTTALSNIRTAVFVIRYTSGYLIYAPILGHASLYDWHGAPIGGNIVWTSYASAYVQGATAYNNGTAMAGNAVPRNTGSFQVVEFLTTGNVNAGRLGNDRGGSWFKGDYAEVILYDNVLDASSRNKIETYIHEKYGLAISGI
jgi:prepilin-type N-terminal cleavage/methylation domain-containing protein